MPNARSAAQKTAKADTIAAAALALQRELRFEDWTVAQVARRAGVAKGTVFLYFESKEALGLTLLERLQAEWFDELDARLDEVAAPLTPASTAQLIARSLELRTALRRTLALGGVMEHRAGRAAVTRYRSWLLDRATRTGQRMEVGLPFLRSGEGIRLLMLVQALVIGYHGTVDPSPAVEAALSDPSLAPLRVDFRRAVAEAVWMQLEGLKAAR